MAASPADTAALTRTILVATDFSSCSQALLDYAALLARRQRGRILLAHVLYAGPVFPFEEAAPPELPDVRSARLCMETALNSPRFAGLEHEVLMPHGDICTVLEELVSERRIDFVVVGTHGRKGIKKLVQGSVAEHVLRCAPCPVLTVGPLVPGDSLQERELRHVLVAADFSPACKPALLLAGELAEPGGATVELLHVAKDASEAAGSAELLAREVERVAAARPAFAQGVKIVVETGDTAKTIVRVARERGAGLIVMGLHRESPFLASHLGWTTAHRVLIEAPCPVLTLPCAPAD